MKNNNITAAYVWDCIKLGLVISMVFLVIAVCASTAHADPGHLSGYMTNGGGSSCACPSAWSQFNGAMSRWITWLLWY